ncbi:MAG: WYL domain-containing protein [Burkholderiaceae bacterium]|nr:WYL domain-containing protein [Burkholderiaceae bacterium]
MTTLLRQLTMLRFIPRHPRRIDSVSLREKLEAQGFSISLRTIQRDLNDLSLVLPLEADESKPQGWWWSKDAAVLDIPGLDPQAALVFCMVENNLKEMLPSSTLGVLEPWFRTSRCVLAESGSPLNEWPNKIRILPKGPLFITPEMRPFVQQNVYQALLENRMLRIRYRARDASEARLHEINPLAIVLRGDLAYLVGTIGKYSTPLLLLLHRMESVEILDKTAVEVDGFDLDRYISNGELGYRIGPPIKLVVDLERKAATSLHESRLSEDQVIEDIVGNEGWVRLRATVADTLELRAWLRGFGRGIVVRSPGGLLDED